MNALRDAVTALERGGVVLHATEGVWGFACDPFAAAGLKKIMRLKERPQEKGLLLIAADARVFQPQLEAVAQSHAEAVRASWPGHHTWVLPDTAYPALVRGGRETVACRVPDHEQARALCAQFGGALVSTSANVSGQPAITDAQEAERQFGARVDCFLPGEVGNAGRASVIHGLDGEILR